MKKLLKSLLQALFGGLGYDFFAYRKSGRQDIVPFDRNSVSLFYKKLDRRKLYEEGLHAARMEWSDNFSKQCRLDALIQLARRSVALDLSADAAECGCWKGHSTYLISSCLKDGGFKGRLRVFDSFEGGLSDLAPEDENERFQMTAAQIKAQKEQFASTEEEVRRALKTFPFVDLYKGWIPERFSEVEKKKFSFVHVDVDLYEPIRDSLAFFYPRVIPGGAIVLDDYGFTQFPGAKKAVDEYLKKEKPRFFFELPTGGAFIIR